MPLGRNISKLFVAIMVLTGMLGVRDVQSQIKTSITGLEGHQAKTDQIKNWRSLNKEKIKDLKRERKELIKAAKDLEYNLGYDKYLRRYKKVKQRKDDYQSLADSLKSFSAKDLKDSSAQKQAQERFKNQKLVPKDLEKSQQKAAIYAKQFEQYHSRIQDKKQLRDSLSQSLEEMAKRKIQAPQYSDNLIGDYEQRLQKMEDRAQKIDRESLAIYEDTQNREKLMGRAAVFGKKHFKDQAEKLEATQSKLTSLKEKYGSIPDSSDLKNAKKANSLHELPLAKRLTFGGTLQLHIGEPVNLDFNPQIGYRINKKWQAGLGASYRSSFGKGERFVSKKENAIYGGRLFSDYILLKSFFGRAELEMLHTNQFDPTTDRLKGQWSEGLLVGIGKEYNLLGRLQGNAMLLYNFLYDKNGPYDRPFVVRFGVQWK